MDLGFSLTEHSVLVENEEVILSETLFCHSPITGPSRLFRFDNLMVNEIINKFVTKEALEKKFMEIR